MPAARGLKRTASKASGSASSGAAPPKIKKKHGVTLEVPVASRQRGRLYACGQGDVGQLGLGEDVTETTTFKFVSSLGEKIVDACAGGMHSVALDSDGKVWTFGCNDEGALGRAGDEFSVGRVELPGRAVAVSAGDSHTAVLLDSGEVYLWGSFRDSHGSMGLVCSGREGKACGAPVRLALPQSAAGIASGGDHLVVTTVTGVVYTVGCGEQGQLGRLSQRSASRHARQGFSSMLQPAPVTLKAAARRAWAGYHATVAQDANSPRVLVWGLNNYGQLGVTGAKKKVALYAPMDADAFNAIDDVDTWEQVSCGQHHSLALDNNGKCYAIGRCEYGRLGLGDASQDAESLVPVPSLEEKKVVSISAATSSSFAVTDNGEVYAWGMGSEGQLGTGGEEDQASPRLISLPVSSPHKPVKVTAGGQHTLLVVVNLDDVAEEAEPEPLAPQPVSAAAPAPAGPSRGRRGRRASAQPEPMEVDAPAQKKLNGEDDVTPMETDETDKPEEEKGTEKEEKPEEVKTEESKPEPQPTENADAKPTKQPEEKIEPPADKPESAEKEVAQPESEVAQKQPEKEQPESAQTQPEPTKAQKEPETKPEPAQSESDKSQPEPAKPESAGKPEVADKLEPQDSVATAEKPVDKPGLTSASGPQGQSILNGEGETVSEVVEKKLPNDDVRPVEAL